MKVLQLSARYSLDGIIVTSETWKTGRRICNILLKSYITFKIQQYTPHPSATDTVKLFSVAYKSRDCAFHFNLGNEVCDNVLYASMGLGFFEGENIG